MSEFQVDLLAIAGVNHEVFYNGGEDVRLEVDDVRYARVFRKGGRIVYRSGHANAIEWDGDEGHPVA